MDAELAKTIAAYGGLSLGLVNFALTIYKDYWRKGRLDVFVGDAYIRTEADGAYDIEVPIQMRGRGGPVALRSAEIRCKTYFSPELKKSHPIGMVMDHPGRSLLDVSFREFGAELDRRSEGSYELSTLKFDDKDARFVIAAERIDVPRGPDGFWEWPLKTWELVLHHSAGQSVVPFEFKRHPSDKISNRYDHS